MVTVAGLDCAEWFPAASNASTLYVYVALGLAERSENVVEPTFAITLPFR
jgi:hypothetical protein